MLRRAGFFLVLLISIGAASAQDLIASSARLKTIIGKKVVRIAYRADSTPFAFQDKGQAVGYSIDLCKLIVKSFERQFKVSDLKIEWVPVTVQTRFSAVSGGKADIECGSSTVTLGRMKEVDFSTIIFVESTGIAVSRASPVHSFTEMAGRKIAVVAGTTNEQAVTDQIHQRQLIMFTTSVKDRDAGIAALLAGDVDGYASDRLMLVGGQMLHPGLMVLLPDELSVEPYAIVVPRGDWALRLAVNTGLAEIFRSDQINGIYKRWFEQVGLTPSGMLKAAYTLGGLPN